MTRDTGVPPTMFPTPSRREGRGAAPGTVHHRPTPQFQQQRPAQPSSAAAKAAAAAKALHRRAQERAKTKQQQQQEEEKRISNDINGRSSRPPAEQRNDVFRRSPNQEAAAESHKSTGGSILKKMMTTGQSYRVGPAAEDVKYEVKQSSASSKSNAAGASSQPIYPPGHPGAHYQHHPHMMFGHPPPYGHPHYPYGHPHYHHQERQNSSATSNAKSNEEDADTSAKTDPNNHHHYYAAHNYHQGHQYPPHPSYYDGRNYSSYPHYPGQNPPPPPPQHHQFYNAYHHGNAPPHGANSSVNNAKITQGRESSKSSDAPTGPPLQEQSVSNTPRGSTRHVIGSHTSIHVSRASMMEKEDKSTRSPEKERLPSSTTPRNETIFRHAEDSEGRDLLESTEILLSLSKSFDRGDGHKHNHYTRGSAKKDSKPKREEKKVKNADATVVNAQGKHPLGERPKSPPRIHHFHKQANVSTFEPQPSPVKMDPNDIELAPSFQLFNQSFDMNLEHLLGPNASFGLGPMKSLSFGLGLPNPSDVGASPRASPMTMHHRMSPRVAADAAGVGNVDFGSGPAQPKLDDRGSNLQVLRASPSNSFGNVISCGESLPKKDGGSSVVVLGDSARVATLPAASHRQLLHPKKRKKGQMGEGAAAKKTKDTPAKRKKATQTIDSSLFEVLETHQSMFAKFSFLLPGAKAFLDHRSRSMKSKDLKSENDVKVSRRRINSALCAFGGVVIPPAGSIGSSKSGHEKKYEDSLPDRYYEEENRLSWEIEEDPPVELDFEESDHSVDKNEAKKRNRSSPKVPTSLQRDIGVMVYPAVNAFTAAEPGIMTPALDEMNNFVDSPSRSTPLKEETKANGTKDQSLPLVSPDNVKTPQRSINYAGGAWMSNHQSPVNVTPGKDSDSPTDLLFVDTQDLLPEQFRIVNVKKQRKASSSQFVYPALPLPYGQRKRISNAMFAMSKSVPGLTDECASVLGEARKKDAWDFAVAQLMTQVVVLTHCSAEDSRLDGLSKYLLTLGIAA